MKQIANSVVKTFDKGIIKRIKRIILYVFIALIVLDILFVFPNGFPTISLVIYNSSPEFIVLLWFFGLATTNVFFQRTAHEKVNLIKNFLILSIISVLILFIGFMAKLPDNKINCTNYKTEIDKIEIPYLTRVLCQDFTEGLSEMKNCDCKTLQCNAGICNDNIKFKVDFTVQVKFIILLLGLFLGYYLWPKINDESSS